MYKRNDHDRFSLFVFISIVIHIVVFVVIPFGNFSVMGNRGEIEEYGFLQIVEYESEITQPNSTIEETVDDVSPAEEAYTEPEAEPYIEEEPVIEEVIEEVSELDEIEDILEEETIEEDVNQNETELIDELVTADDQGSYIENQVEKEHEIITSETGDIEISISESEEKGNDEENEKGVSGSDDEKTGAEQEISPPPPPPPPPPPTAGDMILGAPVPAYPKDLVSQALTGKVELEVHVLNDGSIERVDILNSSGIDQMDRTAQLTLERGWSFKDYSQSYSIIIIVEYNINNEGNPDIKVIQKNIYFK